MHGPVRLKPGHIECTMNLLMILCSSSTPFYIMYCNQIAYLCETLINVPSSMNYAIIPCHSKVNVLGKVRQKYILKVMNNSSN